MRTYPEALPAQRRRGFLILASDPAQQINARFHHYPNGNNLFTLEQSSRPWAAL
jgi:hypothetical protein